MFSPKQKVKEQLIRRQHRKYQRELDQKNVTYDSWIRGLEEKAAGRRGRLAGRARFLTVFLESWRGKGLGELRDFVRGERADILLFVLGEGEISPIAQTLLGESFALDKRLCLAYGDEDVKEDGVRKSPWFKPDWSPDTFLSCFYLGSLTAVRAKQLCSVLEPWARQEPGRPVDGGLVYELYRRVLWEQGAFDLRRGGEACVRHIPQVLFHGRREGYELIRDLKLGEGAEAAMFPRLQPGERGPLISVIIPSKDHPQVLFTCVRSLVEKTGGDFPYEIWIVDNGSSPGNREETQRLIREIETEKERFPLLQRICYHYEPMPFNFSVMCNLGASLGEGELYLFLNDDMEILSRDWLERMARKALLPYAGAVGAKLLYPDTRIIQHAGVTNLRVGPAHKLQFLSDEEDHYYGMNRGVRDMLAVTGACLLVRSQVFREAGGFARELAVAFNDVDLCYRIYELGFYNIQRNDVVLYHHESLSRGHDGESEEKQQRMIREKGILYERHPNLYGRDPFYHPLLTTDRLDQEYLPAVDPQLPPDMEWAAVRRGKRLGAAVREDACVVVGMECAMDLYEWRYGRPLKAGEISDPEDTGYYFQGYTFVIGADNACYKKTLLLQDKSTGEVFYAAVDSRYRQDIRNNLPDQLHVDLTGFAAKVRPGDIPKGIYRLGILMEDQCSRQRLANWSSWVFENR